jgi:hypothetical protein
MGIQLLRSIEAYILLDVAKIDFSILVSFRCRYVMSNEYFFIYSSELSLPVSPLAPVSITVFVLSGFIIELKHAFAAVKYYSFLYVF